MQGRRHSPPPHSHEREATPDSSKVRSKESKKAEKRKKERISDVGVDLIQMNLGAIGQEGRRDHGPLRDLNLQLNNNLKLYKSRLLKTDDPPVKGESQFSHQG